MAKITEYPEASSFDQGDVILKDGVNGTKKMTVENLMRNLVPPVDNTLTQQGKPADAKAAGDKIADLKSVIHTPNTLTGCEKGAYRSDDGTNYANDSYIRSPDQYIGAAYGATEITADTGYNFIVWAWDMSGTYVGSYHADGTFTPTTGAASVTSFDCEDFPDYKFKVAMARDPASTEIVPDEGIHLHYVGSTDTSLSDAGKAADAKVVGEAIADLKNGQLQYKITFPRCAFIYQRIYNSNHTDDSTVTYGARMYWSFSLNAPFLIRSNNNNIVFRVSSNGTFLEGATVWHSEKYFGVLPTVVLELRTLDRSVFKSSYVDDIEILTSKSGYDTFDATRRHHITKSYKLPNYGSDFLGRYKLGEDEDDIGCLIAGNTSKRATTAEYICDKDIRLVAGRYGTVTITIMINNQIAATIQSGNVYDIPKNTPFVLGFTSTNGGANVNITSPHVILVDGEPCDFTTYQSISNGQSRRADSAFRTSNDKIFVIGYDNDGMYAVKYGNSFITERIPFDHNPGHANNCNYLNGKVYVSDWTDSTLIHVYDVDEENNTLTYAKDIVMPHPEGRESVEYYVTDDEKQIFFVGWDTGRLVMCYGLYVLTSTGYTQAWERKCLRISLLQGSAVQDGYIYMVENTNDGNYNFTGLVRINMATGATQRSASDPYGAIASAEVEAIIPIGKEVFIAVDVYGETYIIVFKAKELA